MSSVTRADANGSGSSAADATTDRASTAKGTRGPADGPNTIWSKAPTQVAEVQKGPIDFKKIDGLIKDLQIQEMRFVAANNEYAVAQSTKSPDKAQKQATYDQVKKDHLNAQIKLAVAIEAETKRLSRPSSITRTGSDLRDSRDVRRLENAILDHAKSSSQQGPVQDAILENRRLRAARELSELSVKMRAAGAAGNVLTSNQIKEQEAIFADAKDSVIGIRREENDLTTTQAGTAELTKKRLDRLEELLKTVTTREDPRTGQPQKFDPFIYRLLTGSFKVGIGNDAAVDDLAAKYSDQLAPPR